jgi:CheY-like chemotaxis protein
MQHRTPRVLLVDDNKDAVDMLCRILTHLDVECRISYDGATAVAALADWPAELVFLDLRMPGMDGFDTAVAMHALPGNTDLPIVALSGWDGGASAEQFQAAHFAERLRKPVQIETLMEVISRLTAGAT